MQLGEDQLDAADALLRVDVHRHAATIVEHLQRVVGVEDHLHRLGVPGQRLVDAVVDDFLGQVVGPAGVGVHARALAHRIEAGEDFDGFCGIGGIGHGWDSVWQKRGQRKCGSAQADGRAGCSGARHSSAVKPAKANSSGRRAANPW
ncbi:hypothetical protein D3C75_1019000 [compost metagenome]